MLIPSGRARFCANIVHILCKLMWRCVVHWGCSGILSSPLLKEPWYEDLQVMSGRIARMRRLLYEGLVNAGTPSPSGDWRHIVTQIGMFAFTGLTVRVDLESYHTHLLHLARVILLLPEVVHQATSHCVSFCAPDVQAEHVAQLLSEHHIYLTPDGRMAICGLQAATIPRVVRAMDAVLRADPSLCARANVEKVASPVTKL